MHVGGETSTLADEDLDGIAVMGDDEHLRPWSSIADDPRGWLRREASEERGPSRAICLPDDDRRYWLLPEARGRGLATQAVGEMMRAIADAGLKSLVLDIEEGNAASVRVAESLGATRRTPTRVETDRNGVSRTMTVYVLPMPAP